MWVMMSKVKARFKECKLKWSKTVQISLCLVKTTNIGGHLEQAQNERKGFGHDSPPQPLRHHVPVTREAQGGPLIGSVDP